MKLYYGNPGSGKTRKAIQDISEIFKNNNDDTKLIVVGLVDEYKKIFLNNNGTIIEDINLQMPKLELEKLKNKQHNYLYFNINIFNENFENIYYNVLCDIFKYISKSSNENFYLFIEQIDILDSDSFEPCISLFKKTIKAANVNMVAISQDIPNYLKNVTNVEKIEIVYSIEEKEADLTPCRSLNKSK